MLFCFNLSVEQDTGGLMVPGQALQSVMHRVARVGGGGCQVKPCDEIKLSTAAHEKYYASQDESLLSSHHWSQSQALTQMSEIQIHWP